MQQNGTHHVKGYGKLCQASSHVCHFVWDHLGVWKEVSSHLKPFLSFWFSALCREIENARYECYSVVCTKSLFTPFHSPFSVIRVSITRLNIILADRQLAIYKRKWPKRLLAISVIESCLYISYFFFTSFSWKVEKQCKRLFFAICPSQEHKKASVFRLSFLVN